MESSDLCATFGWCLALKGSSKRPAPCCVSSVLDYGVFYGRTGNTGILVIFMAVSVSGYATVILSSVGWSLYEAV